MTALQLVQRYAAHDIQIFVEYCLEDEKTFEPIVLAEFHRAILDATRFAFEHNFRAVNLSPPGSGKTSLLLGIIAFILGRDPALRVKLACASRGAADERVATVGRIIAHNPRFQAVFPHCTPGEPWSDGKITLERPAAIRDASVEGYGSTSKTTGMRCDVLALDDLDDDDSKNSTRRREKTGRGFYEKFLSRLDSASRVVSIQTRWHTSDIVGILLSEETQRSMYVFTWIRAIIAGDLRGRCMVFECILPGEHTHLRHAFKVGMGWAPKKSDILRTVRSTLPAETQEVAV